jgi:Holliday junction resolvase-like predicted endonuclease
LDFRIYRGIRTSSSESYLFFEGEGVSRLGQLDLHYLDAIHGVLILERELSSEELDFFIMRIESEIIGEICPREDFILNIYSGEYMGVHNDEERYVRDRNEPVTTKDLEGITSTLKTVVGNTHNLRGKLSEHIAIEFLETLGYEAKKGTSDMDHSKVDVIATKCNETMFVQVKSGQIGNKQITETVKHISKLDSQGTKSIAIIAKEFSATSEILRENLRTEYGINIHFYHSYQVLKALPQYRQAFS